MPDYHTDNAVFLVYKDWETLFNTLDSNEEAGELIKALFAFAKRGEIAEFSGALKMAFIFMSQQLDRDGHKWEETCNSRSEAGKKGGRPLKAKESKKTNCFSENQNKAKEADKDTDTDTEKETVKGTDISPENVQEIFDMYHDICKSLPKVRLVTDKRKSTVKARLKKYGKEQIREAFEKAERSKFLTGQVKDFKASFDWILNETNLAKIIEGNYDDKSSGGRESGDWDYEERDGVCYGKDGSIYL